MPVAVAESETFGGVGGSTDTADTDPVVAAAEHRGACAAAAAVTEGFPEHTRLAGSGRAAHTDAANAAADGPGRTAHETGDSVAADGGGTEDTVRAVVGAEGHAEQTRRAGAPGQHPRRLEGIADHPAVVEAAADHPWPIDTMSLHASG